MAKFLNPSRRVSPSRQGFTLVEVLVAAIIILLMVLSVTATIRHGQAVRAVDAQRQAARQILVTELEKGELSHALYDLQPASSSSSATVLLDPIANLQMQLSILVQTADTTLYGQTFPRRRIVASASWHSLDADETLVLERIICDID